VRARCVSLVAGGSARVSQCEPERAVPLLLLTPRNAVAAACRRGAQGSKEQSAGGARRRHFQGALACHLFHAAFIPEVELPGVKAVSLHAPCDCIAGMRAACLCTKHMHGWLC